MLNVGIFELLLIAGIALMVVGPEQLPQLFRSAGRWYGQARRAADELRRAFVLEADRQDATERYKQLQERRLKRSEERASFQPDTVAQDPDGEAEPSGSTRSGEDDSGAKPAPSAGADEPPDVNADAPDAPHPDRPVPANQEPR